MPIGRRHAWILAVRLCCPASRSGDPRAAIPRGTRVRDSIERFQHLVIELVAPTGTRAIDATGRVFELDDGGRREPGALHLPLRRRARIPAMASRASTV